MKTSLYHIQLNVSNPKVSLPFYKKLFSYFEYKIIDESENHIGASNGLTDFWIISTEKKHLDKKFHRKSTGLNHISFKVSSKEKVDIFVNDFLKKNKIKPLYDGAKEFPEYREGYYAVYFEDPDRIKFEVTYIPQNK
ncbi:MAG: VOC family protein [Nanoarchaeota archaeon]